MHTLVNVYQNQQGDLVHPKHTYLKMQKWAATNSAEMYYTHNI